MSHRAVWGCKQQRVTVLAVKTSGLTKGCFERSAGFSDGNPIPSGGRDALHNGMRLAPKKKRVWSVGEAIDCLPEHGKVEM